MNVTTTRRRPARAVAAFALAAGIATTAACGSGSDDSAEAAGSEKTGDTISVKHSSGTTTLPANPKNVFVLDHTITDSLGTLGVKPTGAITENAPDFVKKNYPDDVTPAGSLFEPDFDAISDAEPDVIFVGGRSAKQYKKLSEIAPTVDLTGRSGKVMKDLRTTSEPLGKIFGKEDKVKARSAAVQKRIDAIKKKVPAGDTALVLMVGGGKLSTFGPGSRFGTFFDDLGFAPAAKGLKADRHGQVVTPEYIKQKNPDWMFVIDRDAAIGEKGKPAEQVLDNPLVKSTTAAKKKNIIYLDGKRWYILLGGLDNAGKRLAPIEKAVGVK